MTLEFVSNDERGKRYGGKMGMRLPYQLLPYPGVMSDQLSGIGITPGCTSLADALSGLHEQDLMQECKRISLVQYYLREFQAWITLYNIIFQIT